MMTYEIIDESVIFRSTHSVPSQPRVENVVEQFLQTKL